MIDVNVIYLKKPKETPPIAVTPEGNEDLADLCKKFTEWLGIAPPGAKFRYYYGEYIAGKYIGRIANNAYQNGIVILFQKKDGGQYEYWAQKRRRYE